MASGNHNWYTPDWLVEPSRKTMGGIYLDPCSCEEANKTVKADMFYDQKYNGLMRPWWGTVFLNPPYDDPGTWLNKFFEHWRFDQITQGIIIVNAATDTQWFQLLWDWPICFIRGRVQFTPGKGQQAKGGMHPTAIAYVGNKQRRFHREFSPLGAVRWPGKVGELV